MLCLLTITVYSAGPAAPEASAADERNWIDSPLYHRQIPKPADGEGCIFEKWTVKTSPIYDYDAKEYLPQELCVYRAEKIAYAFFEREYRAKGSTYSTLERAMAVSFDGDMISKILTPIEDKFKNDYMTQVNIVGEAKLYFGRYSYTNQGITLKVLDNIIDNLSLNPVSGFFVLNLDRSEMITNDRGDAVIFTSYAFSKDGHQLVGIEGNKLILVKPNLSSPAIIAKKIFTAPYFWPSPSINPFISNDGSIVGYVGSNTRAYILEVDDLCLNKHIDDPIIFDTELHSQCKARELSVSINSYDPHPDLGFYAHSFPNITNDNKVLTYQSHHTGRWHQLSYENFTGNKYLALGDSYASGEGDIDAFGVSHYLKGTNIWGDYAAGIPRENCHVSERSYPFLIAAHAGLQRQFGMETVACSGAVQLNIAKRLDDTRPHIEYVNGVYMGQLTQRDGQDRPRLEGIENATALQQEALDMLLPGRVQQIEQLKRQQPYVATVQISGNDLNFGPIVASCSFNLPTVHSQPSDVSTTEDCDWSKADFRAKIAAAILGNRSNLVKLYAQLKQASPNTQFYAVGYPLFVNQAVFCLDMPSLSPAELEFMRESIRFANVTIRSAASEAGFRYIDIENALGDQAICGEGGAMTSPLDFVAGAVMADMKRGAKIEEVLTKYNITEPSIKRYIRALYTDWERLKSIDIHTSPYLRYLDITQQLFHPNAEGHRLIAEKITGALSGATILSAACDGVVILCPDASISTPPEVPAFFGKNLTRTGAIVESASIVVKTIQSGVTAITKTQNAGGIWVMRQGAKFKVVLMPGVAIVGIPKVVLHSDTYELGGLALESPGVYAAELAIPDSVPVGMHTLEITATTASKAPYYALMPVAVIGSQEDEDGDGIRDSDEQCLYASSCMSASDKEVAPPSVSTLKTIDNTMANSLTNLLHAGYYNYGCSGYVCANTSTNIVSSGFKSATSEKSNPQSQGIDKALSFWPGIILFIGIVSTISIIIIARKITKST